jgi:hypothetical protein
VAAEQGLSHIRCNSETGRNYARIFARVGPECVGSMNSSSRSIHYDTYRQAGMQLGCAPMLLCSRFFKALCWAEIVMYAWCNFGLQQQGVVLCVATFETTLPGTLALNVRLPSLCHLWNLMPSPRWSRS